MGDPGRVIGAPIPRPDSEPKVRGSVRFSADRRRDDALHAKLVLATYAHARILGIDVNEAAAMPGVVAVMTARDLGIPAGSAGRLAEPLARDEVVFAGQPVALVIASSPTAAADAVELVDVRLEPIVAVMDVREAMAPESALVRADLGEPVAAGEVDAAAPGTVHAGVGGERDTSIDAEVLSPNVVERTRYRNGDVDAALAGAAVTVRATFRTSWIHQGYLETQSCLAWVDDDGTLVVESSTQGIFGLRADIAETLGLPVHRVRVVPTPLGGAFGGKFGLLEPLVAAAALRLARPVRLTLDRREDFLAGNPSEAFDMELEIGADGGGRLLGIRGRVIADGGAFGDWSASSLAAVLVAGPYAWPASDLSAYTVVTNRTNTGAYRGPSGAPTAFAIESAMDELADHLDLDPLELRRRNLAQAGEVGIDGSTWECVAVPEVLDALARDATWLSRSSLAPDEGVGASIGYWPGNKAPAAALCRASEDGSIQVITGVVDMTGTSGAFQVIAAEVLGVDTHAVHVLTADTSAAPRSPGSGGSVVTYAAGRAVRAAADQVRLRLLHAASLQLEIEESDLEIVDGVIRPIGTPEKGVSIGDVVRANAAAGHAAIEGHAATEHTRLAPSVAGFVAHVKVDRETGEVAVLGLRAVQDVGRALNPALVTGQQLGGAAQAIGWALHEQLIHEENGQLLTATFLDYKLPRAADLPSLVTAYLEVPSPDGPFGAKGIGEAAVIGGAAAIANAIAAATGRRPRQLPMTPPRVWRLLRDDPGGVPATA